MSASVNGTNISLTRGDSLVLSINVNAGLEPYDVQEGDVIRFAMKSSINADEVLIRKNIDLETMTLTLQPSDTKNLPFGNYVYDIELTTADGFVDTFIGPATFTLTGEVY